MARTRIYPRIATMINNPNGETSAHSVHCSDRACSVASETTRTSAAIDVLIECTSGLHGRSGYAVGHSEQRQIMHRDALCTCGVTELCMQELRAMFEQAPVTCTHMHTHLVFLRVCRQRMRRLGSAAPHDYLWAVTCQQRLACPRTRSTSAPAVRDARGYKNTMHA